LSPKSLLLEAFSTDDISIANIKIQRSCPRMRGEYMDCGDKAKPKERNPEAPLS
jgi:hypothetical protein